MAGHLITMDRVCLAARLRPDEIWGLIEADLFPQPLELGNQENGSELRWRTREVLDWLSLVPRPTLPAPAPAEPDPADDDPYPHST
jgi:predicted DNA-binding transcriptional regulator AlpA